MTDVRLTATNPADSSVVAVACNEKGELKLEEPVEFDGNLEGDLTVSGTASFAGELFASTIYGESAAVSTSVENTFQLRALYDGNCNFTVTNRAAYFGGTQAFSGAGSNAQINADGAAEFKGVFSCATGSTFGQFQVTEAGNRGLIVAALYNQNEPAITLNSDGTADFDSDVIVGSRGKKWMLVEQGGLCHMVEQTRSLVSTADLVEPEYPKLRDVINELDLIEQALQQIMEKLRMDPPAGWPVWDGSA